MASAAENRTDRLVVLMSPTEKRRVAEQARRANMSVSDFVRTATDGYHGEPAITEELLAELTGIVREAAARARRALDALDESAASTRAFDEDAFRRQVRAELGQSDPGGRNRPAAQA